MIRQSQTCTITDTYFLVIHRRNFLLLSYNQGVSVQCNICEPYLQNIYCSVDEDEAWPCGQIALDNSWQNKETTFSCFLIHRGSSQRVVRRISFCRVFFFSPFLTQLQEDCVSSWNQIRGLSLQGETMWNSLSFSNKTSTKTVFTLKGTVLYFVYINILFFVLFKT